MAPVPEPERERSDEEIVELVREMKSDRPDLDWDNLLMGRLAGPATDDRPDFPIWDYPAAMNADPTVTLERLAAARFPVQYFGGGWSVTSIDEELKPAPASFKDRLPAPRFHLDADAVIRRYRALRDAGVVVWDPHSRGLVYVEPPEVYQPIMKAWAEDETPRTAASDTN
jgi:hypothetical protein